MAESPKSFQEEIADMFSMTRDLLYQHVQGFDEARMRQPPGPGGNAALWLLAHLVVSRNNLLKVVAGEAEPAFPWEREAERGAAGTVDPLPAPEELVRLMEGRHAALMAGLRELADADLERSPEGSSIWRRRMILGFFLHEAYHLGQLALARRLAGLDGVVK